MVKMRPLAGILAFLLFSSFINSCVGDTGSETVVVFKGDETDVSYKDASDAIKKRRPGAFRLPAFVGGVLEDKEFFAVFSDAHYDGSSGSTFIAPAVRTSYGDYKKWSGAEDFANAKLKNGENEFFGKVTAVVKNGKIYALASRFEKSTTLAPASGGSTTGWDTVMLIGTVVKSTVSGGDAVTVMWEEEKSLKSLLKVTEDGPSFAHFVGGVGNGVVMKNGTIVLPVQFTHIGGENFIHQASSIIYSTDDGSTWHMGSASRIPTSECSVVEWGEGKLLLSAQFDFGARIVYESNDMGTTWTLSPVFMEVWRSNTNRNSPVSQGSVITAPVDGEDVLLFSHPLNTKERDIFDTLQLWVSDGKRILCVGTISENDKEEHTGNSILAHVGNNLYVTHEINPLGSLSKTGTTRGDWDKVIAISPLPQFFESAKSTVRAWRRLDAWLQTKDIPTERLVGYLGNTEENGAAWTDNYKCVDATVSGGERVAGGFRFSGERGSGAKWPVMSQGQNQVYKFTEMEFTLAATVKIHSTGSAGDDSLIGAKEFSHSPNAETLIGLGFTHEKKWYTVSGKGSKNLTEFAFDLEREYHVALTFADGVALAYVNGLNITNGTRTTYPNYWIGHFYMGGKGQPSAATGSSHTVKNVMLFNRRFEQEEIAQLFKASSNGNLDESMPKEEPTSEPQIHKPVSTKKPTSEPQIHKTVLTTEPKETTASEKKKVSKGNGGGKSVDHSLRDYRNATLKTQMNRADGAATSAAFVPLTCFLSTIILLAGV